MERVKSDFERELGVAQRRRDYEIQSINNQYDCIKQQIDLEYQVIKKTYQKASLRELRNEMLASDNVKKQLPAIIPGGFQNRVPSKRKIVLENAAEKDLKEISRLLGPPASSMPVVDEMKM